jgi:hypothetical protein
MLVKISTIEFEVNNTLPGVKKIVARIDEAMQEFKANFSHLIVDGVVVTDAPIDYVKQNRKDIKEVVVISVPRGQSLKKIKSAKTSQRSNTGTMKVTISNIVFEVKKTTLDVEKMFRTIEETMTELEVYFSHLVIDGAEVNDAPFDYVLQNLEGINNIEVCFLTVQQYLQQVLDIVDTFLERALPAIRDVADEFYGKPNDEAWLQFDNAMSGMSSLLGIINSMISIPALVSQKNRFEKLGEPIGGHLENLKNAALGKDYTLMADILHHEVIPFMESLHQLVTELNEEYRNIVH